MSHPRQPRAFVFKVPSPFATTTAARAAAWRRIVAIGAALGWPRAPLESDVERVGGGIHVPLAELTRRVYWSRPRRIDAGPLAGSIVVVLDVGHPQIAPLDGVTLAVPATYDGRSVPGGAGTVVISLSAGVAITADHEGDEEDPA
jgi:hypothetical protein